MIFTFTDLGTLSFALTSGAVPPSVSLTPAVVGFEEGGALWVQPSVDLPRKSQGELKRLGCHVGQPPGKSAGLRVASWIEILPLERADSLPSAEQCTVLFDLPEGAQLSGLVTEMLRLRNDRQSFRWIDDPRSPGSNRALLRVIGPPYYSLLRALDSEGAATAPRAYVEQAPRVWAAWGYRHPLGGRIKPAAGKMLLLDPPRRWSMIEEAPFRDIYDVLDFPLPSAKLTWSEGTLSHRLRVPLRLTRGGAGDVAELWVLHDDPVAQLDTFVQSADDQLLGRLAFAVGERDGRKVIALRVRPSREAPPELVLPAVGYCPCLKLPNLFVPIGTRLHPPLRRDAARDCLAKDKEMLTWLHPHPDGSFTPESLPEAAFRPLSDWVDYVLEHEQETLAVWIESTRFEFESFVSDEEPPRPGPRKPPSTGAREKSSQRTARKRSEKSQETAYASPPVDKAPSTSEEKPPPTTVDASPDPIGEQLATLEKEFLNVEGDLDAPARQALWPRMAELHRQLGHVADAGICWMHALWSHETASRNEAVRWLQAEASGVAEAARGPVVEHGGVSASELDRILSLPEPMTADVRFLAAAISWSGSLSAPPEPVMARLGPLQQYVERHERLLPVRAVWLAWLGLGRLAGSDTLALARARDRLLERLLHSGLRADRDLPSFLRFGNSASGQRSREVCTWLNDLANQARTWATSSAEGNVHHPKAQTGAYADLIFAFGFARLGEVEPSSRLVHRAEEQLREAGPAHRFLLRAYTHRIQRLHERQAHTGPLPGPMMKELLKLSEDRQKRGENQGTGDRYPIDRLRDVSRILEPEQRIDPYRHKIAYNNEIERTLLGLPDVLEPAKVEKQIHGLLSRVGKSPEDAAVRASIIRTALDQALRVSEEFALKMLAEASPAFDAVLATPSQDALDLQAWLLERALLVATYYGRVDRAQEIVARTSSLVKSYSPPQRVDRLEILVDQCFRSLRKLGLRQEGQSLQSQSAEKALNGKPLKSLDAAWAAQHPEALRLLLHVANAWFYEGMTDEAEIVLKVARSAFIGQLQNVQKRLPLELAYASALSMAPLDVARKAIEELLSAENAISDTYTTSPYYMRSRLMLIEAVVLAIASDDFAVGSQVRRWLDEDEYLVRRRIHEDVRRMMA